MNQVSIFHGYGKFEKIALPRGNIRPFSEELEDGVYEYGISILNVLYKYKVLNKKNLERVLNINRGSTWKMNMLPRTLKMLRKAEYIEALGIHKDNEKDYHIVLYKITKSGADLINKEYRAELLDMTDKEMLQRASINQWHIGIIKNYKSILLESKYFHFFVEGSNPVPSVITIKTTNKGAKKGILNIFTYPAPREDADIQPFFKEVLKLHAHLLTEVKYRPAIIIVLCENEAHASWIAWHTNKYRQTRPFYMLYSQDLIADTENALENLLSCDLNEEGIVHASVDLT